MDNGLPAQHTGQRTTIGVLLFFGLLSVHLSGVTARAEAGPQAVWLEAADGVQIRGDLYPLAKDPEKTSPIILLFHQAGSNRGEYAEIAPRLNELGFHALAIDQRSGGDRWGYRNDTVAKLGDSTGYLEALPDLEGALSWKDEAGFRGRTLIWGSSYSSSLVFLLASRHEGITAVLSFSPGEYLGSRTDEVRSAARKVRLPVLVLTPPEERERATPVFDALPGEDKQLLLPEPSIHGSSMLVEDRNPGAAEIWPGVIAFLERFQ